MWGYDERMLVVWVEELCRRPLRYIKERQSHGRKGLEDQDIVRKSYTANIVTVDVRDHKWVGYQFASAVKAPSRDRYVEAMTPIEGVVMPVTEMKTATSNWQAPLTLAS